MEFACPHASGIIRIDSSYRETRPTPCVGKRLDTILLCHIENIWACRPHAIFFRDTYKHWYGKQLFAKTFWMHSKRSLESLNFVALTKPNKHKMRLEHFSTTWPGLQIYFFSTLECRFKNIHIRFQIHRLHVDGSRIWKEKVADRKIAGCV